MASENLQGVKNIIFDLGGVILNLDMERTFFAFRKLTGMDDLPEYSYNRQHEIFKQYEVGAISSAEFADGLRELIHPDLTNQEIIGAWNAMMLFVPQARLELLERLQKHYRLFLFSNTNSIHYKEFMRRVRKSNNPKGLDIYFEKTYYSHILKMRKPDAQAFQHILDENGLIPEETLFLDDTPGHLEGAKKVGLRTELVTKKNDILTIFEGY